MSQGIGPNSSRTFGASSAMCGSNGALITENA